MDRRLGKPYAAAMSFPLDWKWAVPLVLLAGIAAFVAYDEFTFDDSEPGRLAQVLELHPGMTVAEVGAGKGQRASRHARPDEREHD